jgi:mannose-6-phosphate isomerase-like protein (cupin superfamily)
MAKASTKVSASRNAKRSPKNKGARSAVKAKARTSARAKPSAKAKWPKQSFVVSHHREQDYKTGLRNYAKYRELGVAKATRGAVQAHVIRLIPPCIPAEVSKRHYHEVDFQLVYILKGWMKGEYEGQGEIMMRPGSCWIQPRGIKHTVLDYSDDCEMLEIILPAEFDTVEL